MVDRTVTRAALRELTRIPGVGTSIAEGLCRLGIRRVEDLRQRDPEELYFQLTAEVGSHVDRCVLYVFRCAVYFASTLDPDPQLLKWKNWKDAEVARRSAGATADA